MKTPANWIEVDEVESTQTEAARMLLDASDRDIVFAQNQTRGRGRFDRIWMSHRGDSLTMSLIFRDHSAHPRPYLIGMAVALAAASELHLQLRWPNDLCLKQKKVGGVLTELLTCESGNRVPVVGLGINLNHESFPPEIAERATSVRLEHGEVLDPKTVAIRILQHLQTLPEPNSWADLAPIWSLFDDTPGKRYRLLDGKTAVALSVGPQGELLCAVDGESQTVLAADAIFGQTG